MIAAKKSTLNINEALDTLADGLVQHIDTASVLSHLMALVPGMVYLRGLDGKFLLANHQVASFYGFSQKILLKSELADLAVRRADGNRLWQMDQECIRQGATKHLDESFRQVDGQEIFFHTV